MKKSESGLRYAGWATRLLAHNIDLILMLPFFYLIRMLGFQPTDLVAVCASLYIIYQTTMELSSWRGSVGKRIQRIQIANEQDKMISPRQILIRNLTKIPSCLVLLIGVIWINFDPKRRSWHDLMARTVVIFK